LVGDQLVAARLINTIQSIYPDKNYFLLIRNGNCDYLEPILKNCTIRIIDNPNEPYFLRIIHMLRNLRSFINNLEGLKYTIIDCRGDFRNTFMLKCVGCKNIVGHEYSGNAIFSDLMILNRSNVVNFYAPLKNIAKQLEIEKPLIPLLNNVRNTDNTENILYCHFGASQTIRRTSSDLAVKAIMKVLINNDEIRQIRLIEFPENPDFVSVLQKKLNKRGILNVQILSLSFVSLVDELNANATHLLCLDSALLHLVSGSSIKVFAIFGPTNSDQIIDNDSHNLEILEKQIVCKPCGKKKCANIEFHECYHGALNE
jgi:ADP-heptose:LPS heptosyltransferase